MVLRVCTMQRSLKGWHFTQDNSVWKFDLNFDCTVPRLTMGCSNYFIVLIWSILVHFMYISGPQTWQWEGSFIFCIQSGDIGGLCLWHCPYYIMPECFSLGLKTRTHEQYIAPFPSTPYDTICSLSQLCYSAGLVVAHRTIQLGHSIYIFSSLRFVPSYCPPTAHFDVLYGW